MANPRGGRSVKESGAGYTSAEDRDRSQVDRYGLLPACDCIPHPHVRSGWLCPHEPADERRPAAAPRVPWESHEERLAYERAAREIQPNLHWQAPKDDDGKRDGQRTWLGMGHLCEEISQLADGFTGGRLKTFPRRGMSQKEWQKRQWDVKREGLRA